MVSRAQCSLAVLCAPDSQTSLGESSHCQSSAQHADRSPIGLVGSQANVAPGGEACGGCRELTVCSVPGGEALGRGGL